MSEAARRGHKYDRNYVITHNWLGDWIGACPGCGETATGALATVFALLWRHRKCEGATGGDE